MRVHPDQCNMPMRQSLEEEGVGIWHILHSLCGFFVPMVRGIENERSPQDLEVCPFVTCGCEYSEFEISLWEMWSLHGLSGCEAWVWSPGMLGLSVPVSLWLTGQPQAHVAHTLYVWINNLSKRTMCGGGMSRKRRNENEESVSWLFMSFVKWLLLLLTLLPSWGMSRGPLSVQSDSGVLNSIGFWEEWGRSAGLTLWQCHWGQFGQSNKGLCHWGTNIE